MSYQIQIPTPCHENWDAMQPQGNGRHCESCCKTVVDFTGWEPEAIRNYLMARQDERTCGRFNNIQLTAPVVNEQEYVAAVRRYRGGFLQQFAAIALLVFGLLTGGCMGAPERAPSTTVGDTTISTSPPYPVDSMDKAASASGVTMGAPVAIPDTVAVKDTLATPTMGMIAPIKDTARLKPARHHSGNKK